MLRGRKPRVVWFLSLVFGVALPALANPANRIRQVRISQESGLTVVEIAGDRALNFTTFKQDAPKRVVVDMAECSFTGVPRNIVGDGQLVDTISTSEVTGGPHNISRVVISLSREVEYRVTARGGSLFIYLTPGTGGLLVSAGIPMAPERAESTTALDSSKTSKNNNLSLPIGEEVKPIQLAMATPPKPAPTLTPEPKLAAVVQSNPEPKPVPVVEEKPVPVLEVKPVSVPEVKPAPLSEPKPQPAVESKPAPTPKPKPAPIVEPKVAQAPEPKPAPVVEPKVAPAAESKSQALAELKPLPPPVQEPKPAPEMKPKAAPAPEPKPQTVVESRPAPLSVPETKPVPIREPKVLPEPEAQQKPVRVAQLAPAPKPEPPVSEVKPAYSPEPNPAPVVKQKTEVASLIQPQPTIDRNVAPTKIEEPVKNKTPLNTPAKSERSVSKSERVNVPPPAEMVVEAPPQPPVPENQIEDISPPAPPPPKAAIDEAPQKLKVRSNEPPSRPRATEFVSRVGISRSNKRMTWVGFQQTQDSSQVFVKTNEPVRYRVIEETERLVILELENTKIPKRNDRRFLDTHFFNTAVTMITPREVVGPGRNVRIEIQLKDRVPYTTGQESNVVFIRFQLPK